MQRRRKALRKKYVCKLIVSESNTCCIHKDAAATEDTPATGEDDHRPETQVRLARCALLCSHFDTPETGWTSLGVDSQPKTVFKGMLCSVKVKFANVLSIRFLQQHPSVAQGWERTPYGVVRCRYVACLDGVDCCNYQRAVDIEMQASSTPGSSARPSSDARQGPKPVCLSSHMSPTFHICLRFTGSSFASSRTARRRPEAFLILKVRLAVCGCCCGALS